MATFALFSNATYGLTLVSISHTVKVTEIYLKLQITYKVKLISYLRVKKRKIS